MRSESTSAFGHPSETNEMRGASDMARSPCHASAVLARPPPLAARRCVAVEARAAQGRRKPKGAMRISLLGLIALALALSAPGRLGRNGAAYGVRLRERHAGGGDAHRRLGDGAAEGRRHGGGAAPGAGRGDGPARRRGVSRRRAGSDDRRRQRLAGADAAAPRRRGRDGRSGARASRRRPGLPGGRAAHVQRPDGGAADEAAASRSSTACCRATSPPSRWRPTSWSTATACSTRC